LSPHETLRNNKVEDIAIARFYKKNKLNIGCLVGNKTIECRMYSGFHDAVDGFSKNVTEFFGNSFILAILFWFITAFGFLFVWFALPSVFFISYLFIYFAMRICISIVSKQKITDNLIFLIPQLISFGLFIYKAFIYRYILDYKWKGRSIY
jgi:hypothetical protein